VRTSVSSVDYPASGSASVGRTQGVPIVVTIGVPEDAATGGETPPGTAVACGRVHYSSVADAPDSTATPSARELQSRSKRYEWRSGGAGACVSSQSTSLPCVS
jgi:hypothetical protein